MSTSDPNVTDGTERDAAQAEAERIWPVGREYSPQQTAPVFSVKELDAYSASAFTRGATWMLAWMRENGYEKREPVVDDATVERVNALHQPKKVWESDRSYTLVCSSCLLTAYPCPTVAALTPDGQEKNQ